MIQLIALLVWASVTVALFAYDPEAKRSVSMAVWIPMSWIFIASSRNVSAWLRMSSSGGSDPYLEGSPFDRAVLTAILLLGVLVLVLGNRRIAPYLQSNVPLLMYFSYCLVSIIWSDYQDVALKRWFRAVGDIVMVLIVLSERDSLAAFRRLLTRLGYLLIPLSIIFIRYFPELGRSYSEGGKPAWTGVATDKNALGMLSMIFGLAAVFRVMQILRGEESSGKGRALRCQGVIVLMSLYLLREANSATALSCFGLAGSLMVLTYLFRFARKPLVLHLLVLVAILVPLCVMFLGIGSGLVGDLGRDSTFTGRTAIWSSALPLVPNSIVGAGYESFWLGPRLQRVEVLIGQSINEAHNGYIEIYLNLGWVGLVFLAILLIAGYCRIIPAVRSRTPAGSLQLAYFVAAIIYNFSEAGFKMMHPMWIFLLFSIVALPNSLANSSKISTRASGKSCDERPKLPVAVRMLPKGRKRHDDVEAVCSGDFKAHGRLDKHGRAIQHSTTNIVGWRFAHRRTAVRCLYLRSVDFPCARA